MIDALLFAVRDGIRAAGMNYDEATVEIMDDERPPPRCGEVFVSINGGMARNSADRNLDEYYDFKVTLTMRVIVPLDRAGDQMMARNISRVPLGQRQGFYARLEQLRNFLHKNWRITVMQNQTPPSANDNLAAWSTGTVYGFVEPMRYQSYEQPVLKGGEWFSADPEDESVGMKSTLQFVRCRRLQPQTEAVGPNT